MPVPGFNCIGPCGDHLTDDDGTTVVIGEWLEDCRSFSRYHIDGTEESLWLCQECESNNLAHPGIDPDEGYCPVCAGDE
ncbi:MAG TPA: hypothetical protein EYP19_09100 [Desulfobacterales bacterium]|nr:hypothetical protein [Desulfobacterales bacterium]